MSNKWKVTLSDGSVISDLELNGNNFVSKTPLTAVDFDAKLSHVIIEGPEGENAYGLAGEHGPMMLAENRVQVWPDGYYFVLLDIPESVLKEQAREELITSMELAMVEIYERGM